MSSIDRPHYWRSAFLPDGELLTAHFHQHVFGRHWHDTYVVPVIERGAQIYYYCGGEHLAGPGTIAVINPGEVHTARRATDAGWAYRAFYPSQAFLQGLADGLMDGKAPTVYLPNRPLHDPELAKSLLCAHRMLEEGSDELHAESELIDAFVLLLRRHAGLDQRSPQSTRDRRRVRLMQEILREHIDHALSLTNLASAVGISPHHAAQIFARETGIPPHAWRNQLRLERAVRMLRDRTPVADVAAACGYTDQSHFTRHFRNAYGAPPGRWQAA
jgi:AraC-like DNA-binding protein